MADSANIEFPNWTPKWVREQFKADFIDDEGWEDEYGPESRAQIEQIIRSPDSAILWAALTPFAEQRDDLIAVLAASVWHGQWGFGHVEITASEKRKIAKDVRRHAQAIASRLEALTVPDRFAVNSIAADVSRTFVAETLGDEIELFHRIFNADITESPDFVPLGVIQRATPAIGGVATSFVSEAMFSRLPEFLDGLCASLDEWANRKRDVTKPNDANARRLYFIRKVSQDFVEEFERPMRKETLALASVFFDCSDLDEAGISKLAPVRKRSKNDG